MRCCGCVTIAAVCHCLACCSLPICHNHRQFSHQQKPLVLKALSASYQLRHSRITKLMVKLTHQTHTSYSQNFNMYRGATDTVYNLIYATCLQCPAEISQSKTDPTHLPELLQHCQYELQSTPILIWLHQQHLSLPSYWALFSCHNDQ